LDNVEILTSMIFEHPIISTICFLILYHIHRTTRYSRAQKKIEIAEIKARKEVDIEKVKANAKARETEAKTNLLKAQAVVLSQQK
jgi:hypothetical protein